MAKRGRLKTGFCFSDDLFPFKHHHYKKNNYPEAQPDAFPSNQDKQNENQNMAH
ncbi:hypothetical protein [Neisseria sp. GT4A_CT1]|jgi:transposase|uniref:hypothetical protein n=1 Tax=Neisseria sp. GT4A_CT1 TaxID=665946 RepID=UPI000314FBC7|nr:hypothetical protein [Neisseria sp. GT4A_CT1]